MSQLILTILSKHYLQTQSIVVDAGPDKICSACVHSQPTIAVSLVGQ